MKRYLSPNACILALLLSGCASAPVIEYRTVKPPVPPEIKKPVCPPIDKSAPAPDKARALADCEAKRDAYARELEAALNAYR